MQTNKILFPLTIDFWSGWRIIEKGKIPRWVIKKAVRYYKGGCKGSDLLILKGNHYIYRVWYEPIEQGHVEFHYYKKKR